MSYEKKVILKLMAKAVARAEDVEEAYEIIVEAANTEGLELPSYQDELSKIAKKKTKNNH
ncbi:MAG: hypothetical protein FWC73_03610 [Defluviitaleaceae bacterium]|nr:hypothetical protein [Defluviitaleaceae bacterium]